MKNEFTTVSKNADGSTTECTATFENGQVGFEQTSTPAPGALPVPTQEDAGKAVVVDENGQYGLGSISGGTKLYKHRMSMTTADFTFTIVMISTSSEANTQYSGGPKVLDKTKYSELVVCQTGIIATQYTPTYQNICLTLSIGFYTDIDKITFNLYKNDGTSVTITGLSSDEVTEL